MRLVEQLGSDRYADRESASAALERMGGEALAALKAGRDARDPEIRTRSAGLIRKIEGEMLVRATRVRLDFEDRSIRDVVAALSSQSGLKIALFPENAPRWRLEKVTLREPRPLDFWQAVDRICDAAGLQYNPNMHGYAAQREPVFALSDGVLRAVTPNSDHGPFRVSLLGLHYQRDVMYGSTLPNPAARRPGGRADERKPAVLNPVASAQFTAQLVVAAEPRLSLVQNGPPRSIEAVDDLGNSLVPPPGEPNGRERYAGFFGMSSGSTLQLQVNLHRPVLAGRSIKTLKGSIPLSVSSRRPDPIVVRLDGAVGKSFQSPDLELTVHDVRTVANSRQTTIELSVRALGSDASADQTQLMLQPDTRSSRFDPNHLQLEILDDQGEIIPWFQPGIDLERGRATITLLNPRGVRPRELRYYRIMSAVVNAPFEFTDVPLP